MNVFVSEEYFAMAESWLVEVAVTELYSNLWNPTLNGKSLIPTAETFVRVALKHFTTLVSENDDGYVFTNVYTTSKLNVVWIVFLLD